MVPKTGEMKFMMLSKRLSSIAQLVIPGAGMADIGTDHAYLPMYLVRRKKVTHAVAGEVNRGPYMAAQEAIMSACLEKNIFLRLGNGLAVLKPGEVETIVIAGMGAATMIDILDACPQVVQTTKRLVLQPMIAAALLRRWLVSHHWVIIEEDLILEDNVLYEVIAAEKGDAPDIDPILYEIGPVLWKNRHPLLEYHIFQIVKQCTAIVENMKLSKTAHESERYGELVQKIEELEAWRTCL